MGRRMDGRVIFDDQSYETTKLLVCVGVGFAGAKAKTEEEGWRRGDSLCVCRRIAVHAATTRRENARAASKAVEQRDELRGVVERFFVMGAFETMGAVCVSDACVFVDGLPRES